MASRVGIDLTSVTGVREAIAQHGEQYLRRIYTPAELAHCAGDAARLAGRFAVKEATVKVLRPGRDTPLPWTDIEVESHASGHLELILNGQAAHRAVEQGLHSFAISLSHEHDTACAVVIAEIDVEGAQDTCR